MGLSRTANEINGNFCQKSQIFPNPMCLTPPLSSPWNFVTVVARLRKLESWERRTFPPGHIPPDIFPGRFRSLPENPGINLTCLVAQIPCLSVLKTCLASSYKFSLIESGLVQGHFQRGRR